MQLSSGVSLHNGTYKIKKVLGQGSFGITYLAEHTSLGKNVTIKEFFMRDLNSREQDGSISGVTNGSLAANYAEKFRKEARNLANLEHANIVNVTDCFEENNTFYYVMEYIEGQNLNEFINAHKLTQEEAISIIKNVAEALTYMHEKKHMLHLDVKPSNIMRRRYDGHIFLIDFGLSKHFSKDGQPETSTTIGLGTAGYAPIEQSSQAKNNEFRPSIDVYALGATMFKLLTSETPPNASELVSEDELIRDKLMAASIDEKIISSIEKAMCPSVKKRFQTAKEFANSLDGNATQISEAITINDNEEATSINSSEEIDVISADITPKQNIEDKIEEHNNTKQRNTEKNGNSKIIYFIIAACIIVCIIFIRNCSSSATEPIDSTTKTVDSTTNATIVDSTTMNEATIEEPTDTIEDFSKGYHEVEIEEEEALTTLEKKIVGKHNLSIQWISWDYFGTVEIKKIGKNNYTCIGAQYGKGQEKGDYIKLDGHISIVNQNHLKFTGTITHKSAVGTDNNVYVRNGTFDFKATNGRAYWREQDMTGYNGCTDYVDIYMAKL